METQTDNPAQTTPNESTHRSGYLLGAIGLILAIAVLGGVWWLGSGDNPATEPATSAEMAVVDQWAGAMTSGDATALAALYTEDGVWECMPIPHTFVGRTSIEHTLADALAHATFTEMTLRNAVAESGLVMTEWTWSGTSSTHTRDASDQTPFATAAAVAFKIEDGLITRSSLYYDYEQLFN